MTEKWKPINGFESSYEVSNLGRVRSLSRQVAHWSAGTRTIPGLIRTQSKQREGYLSVCLYEACRYEKRYVHRLVADHFIPNPCRYPQVNHKDGDKTNNRDINLEWSTASANCQHAIDNEIYQIARGERVGSAVLTAAKVRKIRAAASSGTMHKILAAKYGVKRQQITKIVNRQQWAHVT